MKRRDLVKFIVLALVFSFSACPALWAKTGNGNELARYFMEAKTEKAQKEIMDEALRKSYYFRYLRVDWLQKGWGKEGPMVDILSTERSSQFCIKFRVQKTMSLVKLSVDPETKVGNAIAVTGVIDSMDWTRKIIVLNPVIVRSKDWLVPKPGKEFLYEIDSSATFYSWTGGDEPANVSYADRDLVEHKGEFDTTTTKGKKAWTKFLLTEMAKRDKERERIALEAFNKYNPEAARLKEANTNAVEVDTSSNIVDDPK